MKGEVQIEEAEFGRLVSGEQVKLFKLRNQNDFQLNLISYGASIQSVLVKDKENKLINVTLGFDTLEGTNISVWCYSFSMIYILIIFAQNTLIDH
jgi:aldose 1-epimerase